MSSFTVEIPTSKYAVVLFVDLVKEWVLNRVSTRVSAPFVKGGKYMTKVQGGINDFLVCETDRVIGHDSRTTVADNLDYVINRCSHQHR